MRKEMNFLSLFCNSIYRICDVWLGPFLLATEIWIPWVQSSRTKFENPYGCSGRMASAYAICCPFWWNSSAMVTRRRINLAVPSQRGGLIGKRSKLQTQGNYGRWSYSTNFVKDTIFFSFINGLLNNLVVY